MLKTLSPIETRRLRLEPYQFTMLGDELPDNVNTPTANRQGRFKHRRTSTGTGIRGASQSRERRNEKGSY